MTRPVKQVSFSQLVLAAERLRGVRVAIQQPALVKRAQVERVELERLRGAAPGVLGAAKPAQQRAGLGGGNRGKYGHRSKTRGEGEKNAG